MTQQTRAGRSGGDLRTERANRMTAASSLALRSGGVGNLRTSGPILHGPFPIWAALWLNTLTYIGSAVLPIPASVGQLMTQGALGVALLLALMANPSGIIRPNLVLILITIMALAAFLSSLHSSFFFGSSYRGLRLLLFVVVLWLCTRWWGRSDLVLLRAHLRIQSFVLGTVVLGAVLFWGGAHAREGRLSGVIWPIPPPQVAHYAAMLLGLSAVLWFTGRLEGRTMLITLFLAGYCLIDSHTRTALAGGLAGLIVAGASLFVGHARVRRTAAVITALIAFVGAFFAPYVVAWLSRGQSAQDASQLTGRTKVWTQVIDQQRPWANTIFGDGLSNKSFNGLPIDSNWIATYLDQGLFGAGLIVAFLITLLLMALTRPRGPRRAIALYIVTYCVIASFTETGLGDASPYLLDICIAAAMLARPANAEST